MLTKESVTDVFKDANVIPVRQDYIATRTDADENPDGYVYACAIGSLEHALGATKHGARSYYGLALANGETMVEAAIGLEDGFMGWTGGCMGGDPESILLSGLSVARADESEAYYEQATHVNRAVLGTLRNDPLSPNQFETYKRTYMAGAEAWHDLHCEQEIDDERESTTCRLCDPEEKADMEAELAGLALRVDPARPDPVWVTADILRVFAEWDDTLKIALLHDRGMALPEAV